MTELEVLRPGKNHSFRLFLFVFGLFAFLVFGISLLIEVYQQRWELARAYIGMFVFLAILASALYYGPGRFVVIDSHKGISKPSIFWKSGRSYLTSDSIKGYSKICSIDDDTKVVGIIILTTKGEKIRYSDRWTPECSTELLRLLQEWTVKEIVPEKKYWG